MIIKTTKLLYDNIMTVCVFIFYLLAEHSLSVYFWYFHKNILHRLLCRMYTLHQTVDWILYKLGTVVPIYNLSVFENMQNNNMIDS